MNDPKTAGEEFENVMENIVSSASPLEEDKDEGGTDKADRRGDEAVGDDAAFNG